MHFFWKNTNLFSFFILNPNWNNLHIYYLYAMEINLNIYIYINDILLCIVIAAVHYLTYI